MCAQASDPSKHTLEIRLRSSTPAPHSLKSKTPMKLGNYEITTKLGEGGMGEVWRAHDARLNRSVAVKILAQGTRFEQEATALGALNHPNIVAVYDAGQDNGQFYIVSELVDGESLRALVEHGRIPVRKLIDIAVQIADALAAAHAV